MIENSDSDDDDDDMTETTPEYNSDDLEPDIPLSEQIVDKILKHKLSNGRLQFLTKWEGFPVSAATWEPISTFVYDDGRYNLALTEYAKEIGDPLILEKAKKYHNRPRFQFNPPKSTSSTDTQASRKPGFRFSPILPGDGHQSSEPSQMPSASRNRK